ncbi:uncharacterized protein PAC_18772 [Phialocephala subalpina]|uniref:Zn(2)-C6 fungal-type domain-containing protein n=1 Tax=Phialocephala subalpina TaxID=576137 RepID=A0A1L7XV09_9HELO|nr:uncharacterized protein PAC_18772 [Phialocephala subalpina]
MARQPSSKRQQYTPVACNRCQRRKTKCSGGVPCRQCFKHGSDDCSYSRVYQAPPTTTPKSQNPSSPSHKETEWEDKDEEGLGIWKLETEELVDILEPLNEVQRLARSLRSMAKDRGPGEEIKTLTWDDQDDSRNVDFLNVLVACSMAPGLGDMNVEVGEKFILEAERNNFVRSRCMDFDLKDLAIMTMLSVYRSQCDDLKLACRQIGNASRLCLELGLHRVRDPAIDYPKIPDTTWRNTLFWCIYLLDRRYNFMSSLPVTLQDTDINFQLLQLVSPLYCDRINVRNEAEY